MKERENIIFTKSLLFLLCILIFIPLISAINYGEGSYGENIYEGTGSVTSEYCGDGICNNGETCSSCPADCGSCPISPPSGGGSSGESSCTYDWQCTNWFPLICPESGTQERICMNKGTCKDREGMPNQTQKCEYLGPKEPLFDIFLSLEDKYKETCSGSKIKANVKLENYAKVELLDAFMTYWIIDENNKLIVELKDTRAVEKETSFNIELKVPDSTSKGTYRLYAQITYSGNKTAIAGETFEVLSQDDCVFFSAKYFNWNYLIYAGIAVIGILGILFLVKLMRRKFKHKIIRVKGYQEKIKENLRRIKRRHYLVAIFGFIFISLLFISENKLTGFAVNSSENMKNNLGVVVIAFIIIVFGLSAFTYRKKLFEFIENRKKKHPHNSLRGLVNKKVYTESGDYVGKVKEIILKENKIDNLKIRLDKKHKIKGVVVNYRYVKNVKEIVIVENGILEKLTKK